MASNATTTTTTTTTSTNPSQPTAQPTAQPTTNQPQQPGQGAQAQPFATASLYVGDLAPDVTETQLYEVFKTIGPVASIRVCRDAVTRRSLGYAYVNYHNPTDAKSAIEQLNYKEIRGKPCRIMFSQRDPSLRRQGTGNIFIKNLDSSVDNKALYDTFSIFGNILSCKVATDETGQHNRGYAFVHFETEEAANKAIEAVNGKLLAGKKAYVARFVSAKERAKEMATKAPKWTNIFIKNMPKGMTEDRFRQMFSKFGKITSLVLRVMTNPFKGAETRSFGFINYENHEEAARAVDEMNGKDIDGTEIFVGRAQKKAEREKELRSMFDKLRREKLSKYQGVNLFIKNLDETIDDDRVRTEFASCGTITSAKIMRDEKGTSKGFGFVCFSTPDEATKAVTEMNGKMLVSKPIYVALAERKEQRRAKLEQQFHQRAMALRMQPGAPVPGGAVYPQPVYYGRPFVSYPQMMPRGGRGFPPRSGGFPGNQGGPMGTGAGFMVQPGSVAPVRGGPGRGRGAMRGPMQGNSPVAATSQPITVKYNANVRNPQQPMQPNPTNAAQGDQKQILGEQLYNQITETLNPQQQSLAGKITGMLLESMSAQELKTLTENSASLNQKIAEALDALETKKP